MYLGKKGDSLRLHTSSECWPWCWLVKNWIAKSKISCEKWAIFLVTQYIFLPSDHFASSLKVFCKEDFWMGWGAKQLPNTCYFRFFESWAPDTTKSPLSKDIHTSKSLIFLKMASVKVGGKSPVRLSQGTNRA